MSFLLEACNITFGYGPAILLYDVSLQLRTGEMVALLGPNGSGKTTLLRLLSGVLHPQQGAIMLEGHDLRQWGRRQIAQRIAVVPQDLHMPFAFTVEQMVQMGRTPFARSVLGIPGLLDIPGKEDQQVVEDALNAADITDLAERIFNELSGGERQRVMIAMALAQQPTLLLLDEPTSHLDIKYQIETLELIERLNRERRVAVIAAMHDLNLAARYFPRLLLFQRGIVADAGPAEVLEPGLLSRVYDINVQVGILRGAQHLSVLPPGNIQSVTQEPEEGQHQPRVHVMAGGGSGEVLMRALADAHIPFVAGALHIGDSDHTLALRLAQTVITEQPYAPLAPATVERLRASLAHAQLLILCPAPIGPGNLALLQEALTATRHGLSVLLLASPNGPHSADQALTGAEALSATSIAERDYTGGEAVKLMQQLLQSGATLVPSVQSALKIISSQIQTPDKK